MLHIDCTLRTYFTYVTYFTYITYQYLCIGISVSRSRAEFPRTTLQETYKASMLLCVTYVVTDVTYVTYVTYVLNVRNVLIVRTYVPRLYLFYTTRLYRPLPSALLFSRTVLPVLTYLRYDNLWTRLSSRNGTITVIIVGATVNPPKGEGSERKSFLTVSNTVTSLGTQVFCCSDIFSSESCQQIHMKFAVNSKRTRLTRAQKSVPRVLKVFGYVGES